MILCRVGLMEKRCNMNEDLSDEDLIYQWLLERTRGLKIVSKINKIARDMAQADADNKKNFLKSYRTQFFYIHEISNILEFFIFHGLIYKIKIQKIKKKIME